MYDSTTARWMSKDRIDLIADRAGVPYGDGPNSYQYARSNPVMRIDPSGRYSVCCTFDNGSEIWSETMDCQAHFNLPGPKSAAACCADRASGLWDWSVIGSSPGRCSPPPPQASKCSGDWTKLGWLDCLACCHEAYGAPLELIVGTVVVAGRVPKGVSLSEIDTVNIWRKLCTRYSQSKNLTRGVKVVYRAAGRAFVVEGVWSSGAAAACAARCGLD